MLGPAGVRASALAPSTPCSRAALLEMAEDAHVSRLWRRRRRTLSLMSAWAGDNGERGSGEGSMEEAHSQPAGRLASSLSTFLGVSWKERALSEDK